MRLWSIIVFLINSCKSFLKSFEFSSLSANCFKDSATAVFNIIFAQEIDSDDPNARNSNLFPVNAKGDVLFLSVESLGSSGKTSAPIFKNDLPSALSGFPVSIDSKTASSSEEIAQGI